MTRGLDISPEEFRMAPMDQVALDTHAACIHDLRYFLSFKLPMASDRVEEKYSTICLIRALVTAFTTGLHVEVTRWSSGGTNQKNRPSISSSWPVSKTEGHCSFIK